MKSNATQVVRVGMATVLVAAMSLLPVTAVEASRNNNNRPLGNNGTVKVGDVDLDNGRANDPHVGCTFEVQWFGFDQGAQTSEVSFETQGGGDYTLAAVDGDEVVNFEATGPGNDHNATEVYELDFDGEPHPQQGYHVKVTVNTTGSQGNDQKSKVFWVQDCDDAVVAPGEDVVTDEDGDILGDTTTVGGKGVVTGELANTGTTSQILTFTLGLMILAVATVLPFAVNKKTV